MSAKILPRAFRWSFYVVRAPAVDPSKVLQLPRKNCLNAKFVLHFFSALKSNTKGNAVIKYVLMSVRLWNFKDGGS